MFLYDSQMQRERQNNIKLHPKMWIQNAKGIQQLIIQKMSIQFIDEHVNCNKTLTFHLHDGCFKSKLAHKLVNPNQWIKNVN
jgi:hypothetical protein